MLSAVNHRQDFGRWLLKPHKNYPVNKHNTSAKYVLQSHNFGTTGPIQVGFSAKCTSPNEHFNQTEN